MILKVIQASLKLSVSGSSFYSPTPLSVDYAFTSKQVTCTINRLSKSTFMWYMESILFIPEKVHFWEIKHT